MGHDPHTV